VPFSQHACSSTGDVIIAKCVREKLEYKCSAFIILTAFDGDYVIVFMLVHGVDLILNRMLMQVIKEHVFVDLKKNGVPHPALMCTSILALCCICMPVGLY
jgi:hypothetical protein